LQKREDKRRGDDDRHRRDRNRDRGREEDRGGKRSYFERDPREEAEEQQKGFSNQDKEM
jgi:hypothetical protein